MYVTMCLTSLFSAGTDTPQRDVGASIARLNPLSTGPRVQGLVQSGGDQS